jgi:beta-N-acetylhexosaminidase
VTTSRVFIACVLTLGLIATGCGSGSGAASASPSAALEPAAPWAQPESCVTAVYERMTQAQRVGQLFLLGMPPSGVPGVPGTEVRNAIRAHHFGSVLFVGDSTAGVAEIRAQTSAVQSYGTAAATAGTRFFVATNAEGGQIQQLAGPGFTAIPSAVAQGQLSTSALERDAASWGRELRSAGVNLDLAPVMDVVPAGTAAQNAPIGMLQREYGDNPGTVASHGVAFIRGMRAAGVATSAKHFPGLGRVRGNTDFTSDVVDTVTTAHDPYLTTFQSAIEAGVPFVMVALATYTRIDRHHLAAFSARVIDGVLHKQLGFGGVVVSDDLGGAAAVAGVSPASRAVDFLAAGGDLITSQTVQAAIEMDNAVLRKAAADAAFRTEVSDAVIKILAVKAEYGLLSC